MTISAVQAHTLPVVIVPVFNAVEQLAACLASLDRTLAFGARVAIADDASTDPGIARLIAGWKQCTQLDAQIVVRERNLGFIGNVNRTFAECGDADVVLLNSDTVTTTGWLQRIAACAASDPRIATITPWSNNAEICSFPALCENNPVPDDPDRIAAACASAGAPEYPELPTAVGFCMYIRRAALRQTGDFDTATFGRGYGEENDFCLRVAGMGWRNVLCDDAYVVHAGNASFGPLGERPGGENMRRLLSRWPDYGQRVADFIRADPLSPLRERIVRRLAQMQSLRTPSD